MFEPAELLRDRVGYMHLVEVVDPDSVAANDMSRNADGGTVGRNLIENHCARGDIRVIADFERAEHLCAGADHDIVAERRMPLADILARAGFEVEACESFEHVSRDILAAAPDLVLLDLTLPVKDGQHICHEVRRESEVPIIVLTSRTTEIDEVMAMTLGADDFVPKPYSARVLVARINALLRRTAAAGERSTLVHKGLELDLARSMVTNTATGDSTELTKNELRILSLLLSRAGKIVSRSAIMQDLWDSDAFVDDNTLTVNINRLRTTLEKIGIKGYLTTHRGQGYSV